VSKVSVSKVSVSKAPVPKTSVPKTSVPLQPRAPSGWTECEWKNHCQRISSASVRPQQSLRYPSKRTVPPPDSISKPVDKPIVRVQKHVSTSSSTLPVFSQPALPLNNRFGTLDVDN
jgi:hypothetical protein